MAVLSLPAVLMHPQAAACRQQLAQSIAGTQDRVVLLDASRLEQFDSSALAVLLDCRRQAQARDRTLQVQGMNHKLRQLASLYGVLGLLQS